MNEPFKKLPICRNNCSKFNNSIINQPKPQRHSRFQITPPKNDYCEFEDNEIVDYGTDRRGDYITNDDNVTGFRENSMRKFVKKSTPKIHIKWNEANDKMFSDELITDNGLNCDTDYGKRKYVTKVVPSSNNKNTDKSNDDMPKTKRTRMTIPQKLSMGLNIDQPLKYCPFCPHVTSINLKSHIMAMHENVMNTPIEDNIKQMLSAKSKGCKLIRLNTVRDIVGRKLWRDQKIRKVLHTLFRTLQVELWLGSWALPNVPYVNHVAPYVKASFMNDWYEQEEAEEVDEPCPSPLPVVPSIYTEGDEQNFNNSGQIINDSEYMLKDSIRSFNDCGQIINDSGYMLKDSIRSFNDSGHILNDSIRSFNDSVQGFNNSVQSLKNNEQILNDSVDNILECIQNIPKYSKRTAVQLKKIGLQKYLYSSHPLLLLCHKHLKKTYKNTYNLNKIIYKYLEAVSKVLRYIQDRCYQQKYKVHHWLVLLQKPDFIIEYLKSCETYSQDKEITTSHIKILMPLFSWAMTTFPYQDREFPMVNGAPDSEEINGFQHTVNQLINTFSDYI